MLSVMRFLHQNLWTAKKPRIASHRGCHDKKQGDTCGVALYGKIWG
jgi:hypothetical protein